MIISRAKRVFKVKWKIFFLVSQILSFKHTKQISKNLADTTFKPSLLHYLWKIFLIKTLFLLKNFRVYCIIYLLRVWKLYQYAFTCLESTMKHQYTTFVKHTWKPCVKYAKSTIKLPEQCEWCCFGIFIFDFRYIFTTQFKILHRGVFS